MALRTFGIALALVTVGCSSAHPTDEVRTGIYMLEIEADNDACTPQRSHGSLGEVVVLGRDGSVDAPVPAIGDSPLVAPRVQLMPAESFHRATNRQIQGCDGAWVHDEWTLMDQDGDGFELLHTQRWEGLASCVPSAEMPEAPEVDCESTRRLQYQLRTACEAPCTVSLDTTGQILCSC